MLDDVVGGYDEKRRKLRQAISIAIDLEENIQIFLNGRGIAAQGPITTPLWVALALLILGTIPASLPLYRRERKTPNV